MVTAVCDLELEFPDAGTAKKIAKALELDNMGYVAVEVDGRILHVTVESDDVMSLRNTIDDFLACATVAQKALEGAK